MASLHKHADRAPALLPSALALMIGVLASVGVVLGIEIRNAQADETRRAEVLLAAREVALSYVSLDTRRVLDSATGRFASDYAASVAELEAEIERTGVVAEGVVLDAGITDISGERAQVVVAADATLTNGVGLNTIRHYRLRADLVRWHGRWLITDLQLITASGGP